MTRPSFGQSSNTPLGSSSNSDPDPIQKHQELSQAHEQLREKRRKWEYDLIQAREEEARCLQEAQAFGVNTPEELEKLLNEQREADQNAQLKFEEDLQKEAELQNKIDQDLASIDQR
jgi:DnaJ-class molecular chaperone